MREGNELKVGDEIFCLRNMAFSGNNGNKLYKESASGSGKRELVMAEQSDY